jgi:hypothetical protein
MTGDESSGVLWELFRQSFSPEPTYWGADVDGSVGREKILGPYDS